MLNWFEYYFLVIFSFYFQQLTQSMKTWKSIKSRNFLSLSTQNFKLFRSNVIETSYSVNQKTQVSGTLVKTLETILLNENCFRFIENCAIKTEHKLTPFNIYRLQSRRSSVNLVKKLQDPRTFPAEICAIPLHDLRKWMKERMRKLFLLHNWNVEIKWHRHEWREIFPTHFHFMFTMRKAFNFRLNFL